MLMPEFYPCIGGWHCDGVFRKNNSSQPQLKLINNNIYNYICVVPSVSNISNTKFINEIIDIEVNTLHVWYSVNKFITSLL